MPRMNLGLPYQTCNIHPCVASFQGSNLLRCGACYVALYCGAAHQRADRPTHKTSCGLVKQTKAKLQEEESALRAHPGDFMTPPNPFENAVGHFWGLRYTRPYMRARYDHMTALLNIRTGEAVQAALDHCLGMLHLCRSDNMNVRSKIPALYLRLGRDQDAYDFITWYAVKGTSTYDWGNMDLPFLDLHGEDALELVEEHSNRTELSPLIALTLIKIRLMMDMMALQDFVKKEPNAVTSAKMEFLEEEAMSDVLLSRRDVIEQGGYEEAIAEMRRQVLQLYELVKRKNPYFWPGILDPARYSDGIPAPYTLGSPEEALLVFRDSWYSWSETEPAVQFIRGVIRDDIRNNGN